MEISDYWGRIENDLASIMEQTASDCEHELNLLRGAFDLYSYGFNFIREASSGGAQIARIALLSQNLNTFHTMISSASKGFYIQALVPLRHVYENWLSFWYLAKFPNEAHWWLNPTWETRPPKAETMQNKIDHPSKQSKSKLKDFYIELNRFAHTDPVAVLSRLQQDGENTLIDIGIRFDADDFRACAYGFSLWIGNCLDAISSLIPEGNDWHSQYQTMMNEILMFIDEYNARTASAPTSSSIN